MEGIGAVKPSCFKLIPAIQHYAWGGTDFLANLLSRNNSNNEPFAEAWYGDHHKGPALIADSQQTLRDLIAEQPQDMLGENVVAGSGTRLPFLLKLLDVDQMLSIQCHPTKEAAEEGFRKEQQAGIPMDANQRVFKDDNHKPELMVALSPFWLLHGFQEKEKIQQVFSSIGAFKKLRQYLHLSIEQLYKKIMTLPKSQIDDILNELSLELRAHSSHRTSSPHHWAVKALDQYGYDRGIFSIYLFNLVFLHPGEAIYQGAGIPHAYLSGQNVEIMANSDNVFRGGLTPKYMDIDLLMKHMSFEAVQPKVVQSDDNQLQTYPVPVPDFELTQLRAKSESVSFAEQDAPTIFLVANGKFRLKTSVQTCGVQAGQAIYVIPGQDFTIEGDGLAFIATTHLTG